MQGKGSPKFFFVMLLWLVVVVVVVIGLFLSLLGKSLGFYFPSFSMMMEEGGGGGCGTNV